MERVAEYDPLVGQQVNVSIDGTTICVVEEGWKEVKGITVSAVESVPEGTKRRKKKRRPDWRNAPELPTWPKRALFANLWTGMGGRGIMCQ